MQQLVDDIELLQKIWKDLLLSSAEYEEQDLHNYLNSMGNGMLFSMNNMNFYILTAQNFAASAAKRRLYISKLTNAIEENSVNDLRELDQRYV